MANAHWWEYGETPGQARAQAQHVARVYLERGEPVFGRFADAAALAAAVPLDEFETHRRGVFPLVTTEVRLALALARIHAHLGDREQSRRFAQVGLARVGCATFLKEPLAALAGS